MLDFGLTPKESKHIKTMDILKEINSSIDIAKDLINLSKERDDRADIRQAASCVWGAKNALNAAKELCEYLYDLYEGVIDDANEPEDYVNYEIAHVDERESVPDHYEGPIDDPNYMRSLSESVEASIDYEQNVSDGGLASDAIYFL